MYFSKAACLFLLRRRDDFLQPCERLIKCERGNLAAAGASGELKRTTRTKGCIFNAGDPRAVCYILFNDS
jgi:hypothetical protein